ncbi:hypothetical protein HYV10_03635 [Candidatus Dependentiae bacterium]|nr:hypothetical protein [Candidatus Dependentiae bacterium]
MYKYGIVSMLSIHAIFLQSQPDIFPLKSVVVEIIASHEKLKGDVSILKKKSGDFLPGTSQLFVSSSVLPKLDVLLEESKNIASLYVKHEQENEKKYSSWAKLAGKARENKQRIQRFLPDIAFLQLPSDKN